MDLLYTPNKFRIICGKVMLTIVNSRIIFYPTLLLARTIFIFKYDK
nr:MAG TPA: hypothetical protein [Caudoviricetes sp.]